MKDRKRIAIISDIHGNCIALKTVLDDIENQDIDSVICLGDIATLGPCPRETVRMIKNLSCPCILGNHEQSLLHPNNLDQYGIDEMILKESVHWCIKKLDSEDFTFFRSFVSTYTLDLGENLKMLCYHGSPFSTIEAILPDSNNEAIQRLLDLDDDINIVVGGHTHFQLYRKYGEKIIVNPGSVGYAFVNPALSKHSPSFLPKAEYAVVEVCKKNISVELKSLNYDIDELESLVNNSDLPIKSWWLDEINRIRINLSKY